MDTIDHLNVALAGKWIAFRSDDEGDFEPQKIERIVDGDVDEAFVLLGTGASADGTNLEKVDLAEFTFWDDYPTCIAFCNEQNAEAEGEGASS